MGSKGGFDPSEFLAPAFRSTCRRGKRSDGPLSEALLTGLAGGVGFLYIVFEYKDTPPYCPC